MDNLYYVSNQQFNLTEPNIKVYYDVLKSNFVIMVITETDENIIIIEGSEFNGKK